tara:strand:+ start:2065 stop:3099 length:1035 start_codon:yes stop_codon:yes gene_type:complete
MAYNWQQDSGPSNLQMLSENSATRSIDEFSSKYSNAELPEEGKNLGLTASQTTNARLTHAADARKKAEALNTGAKKAVTDSENTKSTMNNVYSGIQMTQSLAEMMTSKNKDFDRKTKKFLGTVLSSPMTEKGLTSGIEYIFGETGGEAVGEEAGELTGSDYSDKVSEFTGKDSAAVGDQGSTSSAAGEAVGSSVPIDAGVGEAVGSVMDPFGDLDLEALLSIDIAAEVAKEAAAEEAPSLASEVAGPIVSAFVKTGAGMLGGKGAGTALASAATGVGVGVATAMIPVVGPWLAPITSAASSFGVSQGLGGGKGSGIRGGPRVRTGMARKFIGTPSASQLLRGYG